MTDEPTPSLAEALAEIRRLRAAAAEIRRLRETLEGQDETVEKLGEIIATQDGLIQRLRARILELEAALATLTGSLEPPRPEPLFHVKHDVPITTPR
jgi:uncharacterized protein involved in exopolysaccharide biosynthesis